MLKQPMRGAGQRSSPGAKAPGFPAVSIFMKEKIKELIERHSDSISHLYRCYVGGSLNLRPTGIAAASSKQVAGLKPCDIQKYQIESGSAEADEIFEALKNRTLVEVAEDLSNFSEFISELTGMIVDPKAEDTNEIQQLIQKYGFSRESYRVEEIMEELKDTTPMDIAETLSEISKFLADFVCMAK